MVEVSRRRRRRSCGIAVSAGTLWEVFEFTLDRTGLFQTQKGLTDTMLDLVADTVGALVTIGLFAGLVRLNVRLTANTRP